jgi:hypothetical protein
MRWRAISPERLLVLALVASLAACGGKTPVVDDIPDVKAAEGVEVLPDPPAFPVNDRLAAVNLGNIGNFDYFIDRESISVVNPGGIIRYTVVARSTAGARNVSYEALRCPTWERRVYAVGRSDGTWVPAKGSTWLSLKAGTVNAPFEALARDFFCPNNVAVRDAAEAKTAIARGRHPDTVLRY